MMRKLDLSSAPVRKGSRYPDPFHLPGMDKYRLQLANAAGLSQIGVNLLVLNPGSWSSQRHWHSRDDEFLYVIDGEVVLVTDAGEETLVAGDCAGFAAGDPDGHHVINRSGAVARVLEIGTGHADDVCTYSDIDMIADPEKGYVHKDGAPYPVRD